MVDNKDLMDLNWNTSGVVLSFADGVAIVGGLGDAAVGEMVDIHGKNGLVRGLIMNLEPKIAKVTVFGDDTLIYQGDLVVKLNDLMLAPVGWALLGKTVDILGNRLDRIQKGQIRGIEWAHAEVKAPGIASRQPIRQPLETGILAIDALNPIGRGQRQLILGDRNTGKTAITVDTIMNHVNLHESAKNKLYCIYVAVGIRRVSLRRVLDDLIAMNGYEFTTLVSATASEPAGMQYIAPYVGCAMGEFFRDRRAHALVIYDDLSKHAVAYRQVSLILRRPPGREAFPGDIFYLHSRLLERAAKLHKNLGGGSLSALPIVETQGEDVSAYIPTNVISITDGQIYLAARLFIVGLRPAIDIGLSVSRIGSNAQRRIMKQIVGRMKLDLATYRIFELFKSLGSDTDEIITRILLRGERLVEICIQTNGAPLSIEQQMFLIHAARQGYLNTLDLEQVDAFKLIVDVVFNPERFGVFRDARSLSTAARFQRLFRLKRRWRDFILKQIYNGLVSYIKANEKGDSPIDYHLAELN